MTNVDNLLEIFRTYMGSELWIALLAGALFVVFCVMPRGQKLNLLLSIVLSVVLIFNEWTFGLYGSLVEKATFYRFFWMIPVAFLISYATVRVVRLIPWLTVKALFLAVVLMAAAFAGFSGTQEYTYCFPKNELILDEELLEVAEYLKQEAETTEKEIPRAAMSAGVQMKYRTFDTAVQAVISRQAYMSYQPLDAGESEWKKYPEESALICIMNGYGLPKKGQIRKAFQTLEVDLAVSIVNPSVETALEEAGCTRVGETENYVVWKCPETNE